MPALKSTHIALSAMLALAGVVAATAQDTYKGYELPPYTVEATTEAYELRQYGRHILAEVTVKGDRQRAVGRGFQILAGYIFGGNTSGKKIAMTVPVGQAPHGGTEGDELWEISFMMPSKFTMADLPAANAGAVRFVEVEPQRQMVLRFSGLRTNARLAAHTDLLMTQAAAAGVTVTGPPRYYFYDDPMTAPWARRNEVAVPIAG